MTNASPRPPSSRASKLVFGAFVVLATAFVGSTIAQVVPVVFGADGTASVDANAKRVSPECAATILVLREGVDQALAQALQQTDPRKASFHYEYVRDEKGWDALPDIERKCAGDPHGPEAIAALVRFERASASTATKNAERVGQVRREVDSYIRASLR